MTGIRFEPTTHDFLAQFFGPGNKLTWGHVEAKLQSGRLDQSLLPWLERLSKLPAAPTLLPRPVEDATIWYGLGHSFAQAEQLREELLSAVGPSYSNFNGTRAKLDPSDPVECAVMAFTKGHAFRLRVPVPQREKARAAFDRLRHLWDIRPPQSGIVVRTVGRVLRDFELALTVGDLAEANARLNELRTAGMLDVRNLLFLEIRLLAAGGRWAEIVELEALPDLAQIRCPVVVADAILQALYAVEFDRFEDDGKPAEALARFREHTLGRWASFFRVKSTIRSPSALKLFVMLAVSATPPREDLIAAVLAEPTLTDTDRSYCRALASLTTPSPPVASIDPLILAWDRYDVGDYDGAFPLAVAAPSSARRLVLLLSCGVELGTLEATRAVLDAFAGAPEAVRIEVLKSARHRVLWQHLVGVAAPPETVTVAPPKDWCEWFDRLLRVPDWAKALEVAEQGAREWDADAFLRNGDSVQRLRSLLANREGRSPAADEVLRDAIPFLIAFLTRDRALLPRSRGLLEDLLLILTDETEVGAADMAATKEVIAALIELGPSTSEYRDLLEFLRSIWARFGAPRRIDWLLDALEVLVLCPAPDAAERSVFVQSVFAAFAKWRSHVENAQWRLLGVLCQALDLSEGFSSLVPPPSDATADRSIGAVLRGQTVAIYSLMEKPALHVRNVLLESCEGIEVVLNADHVATPTLRELAKRADLFVMVWRAAKHAATEGIEATRPKHRPLLRPDGVSATSILREIAAWCEGDASAVRRAS